jgi:hypothetical protein
LGTDSWLEAPLSGDTDESGEALIDQRDKTRVDTISRLTIGALMSPDVSHLSLLYYLIQWRMRLAARDLLGAGKTVSTISQSLGYESESAFSNAFKRVMGRAPTHYKGVTRELSEPIEAESDSP